MSLRKLDVYGVRNIQQVSIVPSPALNFIYGLNGSGKSSLLEAIFILGRAGSFRCSTIKNVINHDAPDLIVSGDALQKNGHYTHIGIQLSAKNCDIHIGQASRQKRSELAYTLPIQLIHPTSYQLLDGSSVYRREFMDWGVFNQDEHFLPLWRRFKKALSQRNALLKSKSLQQIQIWDNELVQYAIPVAQCRADYIQTLQPIFLDICQQFLTIDGIQLNFFSGWDAQKDLQQLLRESIDKDCRYGFTHYGPHRGDFQLTINNKLAKDFVSRGQLKLLVLALKLAQVHLLQQKFSKIGCILIDDLAAELDLVSRSKLLRYLAAMGFQAFLTATELIDFGDLREIKEFKMFHVEHGNIKQADVPRGTLLQ
ncbi:MAG: DNA replication/repair protein RecF [Methylococcales bacterium]|nr:DNA replication/repair protein RecF [Methylococcales bacterium]